MDITLKGQPGKLSPRLAICKYKVKGKLKTNHPIPMRTQKAGLIEYHVIQIISQLCVFCFNFKKK